jgi:hypothetical protein
MIFWLVLKLEINSYRVMIYLEGFWLVLKLEKNSYRVMIYLEGFWFLLERISIILLFAFRYFLM